MSTCPTCKGDGKIDCPKCNAEGLKFLVQLLGIETIDCSECKGSRKISCTNCTGSGNLT